MYSPEARFWREIVIWITLNYIPARKVLKKFIVIWTGKVKLEASGYKLHERL